jgi:hypothetical protein
MRLDLVTLGLVSVLALAANVPGQFAPGDLVVATELPGLQPNSPLLGITPGAKVFTITNSIPKYPVAVQPAPDNQGVWTAIESGGGGSIVKVAFDGTITSMHRVTVRAMDTDGQGNMIGVNRNAVLRITPTAVTTLLSGLSFNLVHGAALDLATGDLMIVETSNIYRVSFHGAARLSTVLKLAPSLNNASAGLHSDPETGALFGSCTFPATTPGDHHQVIFRLDPGAAPSLTTVWTQRFMGWTGGWDRDPATGRFLFPMWNHRAVTNAVLRFDARLGTLSTVAPLPSPSPLTPFNAHGVTIAGGRHLVATGPARPGAKLTLMASSLNEPGALYVMGLSLGFRPGIPLAAGRKIHLSPDPLFFYSCKNTGIFSGFQGYLDAKGRGFGHVAIPPIPQLSGVRFFAAMMTLVGTRISVISEPVGITIE